MTTRYDWHVRFLGTHTPVLIMCNAKVWIHICRVHCADGLALQCVYIPIIDDSIHDQIELTLSAVGLPPNASTSLPQSAVVTIVDNIILIYIYIHMNLVWQTFLRRCYGGI